MLLPPSSKLGKDIDAFSDIGLLKVVRVLRYVDGKVTVGESRSGRCRPQLFTPGPNRLDRVSAEENLASPMCKDAGFCFHCRQI